MQLIYEGKAKKVYERNDHEVVMEFTDQATALNGLKKANIVDKGKVNAQITATVFQYLESQGLSTHFLALHDERSLVAKRLRMILLEVVVRNLVAGSLSQRTGLQEGTRLTRPIVELYYKNDVLGDPLLNDDHVEILGLASSDLLARLKQEALRINQALLPFFATRQLQLVDFKLEFGWDRDNHLLLGDEISPDTCRLWDARTAEKLDKDRFRRDLGGVEDAYQEVYRRVMGS